jgi:hypothetical protein
MKPSISIGELRLRARLSETTSGIRSLLRKPIEPLFRKGDAIAITITGDTNAREHLNFGVDVGRLLQRGR